MELAMQLKEQTFLKEKDRLLSFIRNRVSSVEEAEDILQDVFYQFVAGFESIESLDRGRSVLILAWHQGQKMMHRLPYKIYFLIWVIRLKILCCAM